MLKRVLRWGMLWLVWGLMKAQERRWRRWTVGMFYVVFLMGFVDRAGLSHRWHRDFMSSISLVVYLLSAALGYWPMLRVVRSLRDVEERSIAMYGVGFNKLMLEQMRAVDKSREPGSSEAYDSEDEFARAARRESTVKAFAFLRRALLWFAAAYWGMYLWLPDGAVRRGVMDSPMVVTWLVVFVITLPQVVLMWTEPDEVGEAKLVATEREA